MPGRRPRPIPPVPPISPAADPDPGTRGDSVSGSGSGSGSAPGTGFGPDSGSGSGSEAPARRTALEAVLQKVRLRWGHGSIVRLDGEGEGEGEGESGAPLRRRRPPPPRRPKELPPWWPGAGGPWTRPRILELTGEAGEGRLTLALAWLAAARPALVAVVDPAHPSGWFYPPAAAAAGIDLERLLIVRPPGSRAAGATVPAGAAPSVAPAGAAGRSRTAPGAPNDTPRATPRATLDAALILLRSEAFDVVLCPLAPEARIGTTFAGTLATLAARAGTTLFLLTPPQARGLGAFAEYRVRLGRRRWMWTDGEIAGVRLRVATERARAAAGADLGGPDAPPPEHELTLRLHRPSRHGPFVPAARTLYLYSSTRLLPQGQGQGQGQGQDAGATPADTRGAVS
ncbi:MAG TPA: hypothetical protein VHQ00_03455 [Chloroflexota bacterium]|nr:hypothetical protein [Chloroflexota bacterium]